MPFLLWVTSQDDLDTAHVRACKHRSRNEQDYAIFLWVTSQDDLDTLCQDFEIFIGSLRHCVRTTVAQGAPDSDVFAIFRVLTCKS